MVRTSLGAEFLRTQQDGRSYDPNTGFCEPFGGLAPGMMGPEGCGSSSARVKTEGVIAEKYLARHFLSTQEALRQGGMATFVWLPGTEKPAGGWAQVRSDMAPFLRISVSGRPSPGSLRALGGLFSRQEQGGE